MLVALCRRTNWDQDSFLIPIIWASLMLLSPSRAMVVGWPLRHHLKLVGRKWMIIQFIIQTSEGFKCIPSKIFAGVFPLSRCCFFCLVAWLSRRSSSYLHIFIGERLRKELVLQVLCDKEWHLRVRGGFALGVAGASRHFGFLTKGKHSWPY